MISQEIENLTSRHIGRVLSRLDEIGISQIVKESVKKEFWLMSDDVKELIELEKTGVNKNVKESTEELKKTHSIQGITKR